MSFFDTVLSNTLGVVWRAGTGTVDTWTKNNLIDEQTNGLIVASGGGPNMGSASSNPAADTGPFNPYGNVLDAATARQLATDNVNNTLMQNGADPSQWGQQTLASIGRAWNYVTGKNKNLLDPNQPTVDTFSLGMWGLAIVFVVAVAFFGIRQAARSAGV